MKLLVILLCLLSERFLIHAVFSQRFNWFGEYASTLTSYVKNYDFFKNPWLMMGALIFPILAPIAIVYGLFSDVLFGFSGLVISIIIFLYCLGPQNAFYPISNSNIAETNKTQVENYFFLVNRQLFSVIFWYIIMGPIVTLAYRLITLCRTIDAISPQANKLTDLLEWIPARITVLFFLLVGNFQRGFVLFTKLLLSGPDSNSQILGGCGLQAAKTQESDEVSLVVAENLVEQAVIVFMVLIALCTLVAWL